MWWEVVPFLSLNLRGKGGVTDIDFLLQLLQDATKLFITVFVTAYANKLVKSNNKRKRTTASGKTKGGSKRN
ncbi:hypothetical protein CN307_29560 [Bacillus cereus]|uniref:Uncharacterized protein n=1 Tax=Bacillus cereus TaxID=1396 RepID=A0A2A8ZRK9_BACCE|nr:hypothetical protein CN307_29560 [Bacillus cereus]